MAVHLVHARQQRAAVAVDGDLARRRRLVGRFDGDDPAPVDEHGDRIGELALGRVVEAHVADAHRRLVIVRALLLERDRAVGDPFRGKAAQTLLLTLIALAHHDPGRAERGEQLAFLVEQDRLGRQVDAAQRVAGDGERAALAVHLDRRALLQLQRAARQRGDGHVRLLQEHARVYLFGPRAAALRDVERRRLQLGAALAGRIVPAGAAPIALELLVDLAAEGRRALDRPLDRQPVLAERDGLGDRRPAPVVLDVVVDAGAASLDVGGQVPDLLAAEDDRVLEGLCRSRGKRKRSQREYGDRTIKHRAT